MPKFKPVPYVCVTSQNRKKVDRLFFENDIFVGNDVVFGENVIIEEGCWIGDNCFIGNNSIIRKQCVIWNDSIIGHLVLIEAETSIGANTTIQSQCHITSGAQIGHKVFFGPSVCCVNDIRMVKYHEEEGPFKRQGPIFHDGCRIGANSTILPGVSVGKNAIVGAGSTVTKDIPEGETWIGYAAQSKIKKAPSCQCKIKGYLFTDPDIPPLIVLDYGYDILNEDN